MQQGSDSRDFAAVAGFLTLLIVAAMYCAPFAAAAVATATPAKPVNVLLIIADDLNTHLGCYGDPVVRTPNIDRLASRGVRFDRAYCQYPVCNPSRISFLTGMYPETTGITNQNQFLRRDGKTPNAIYLPDHFRQYGYFTAGLGKVEHGGHAEIQWDEGDTLLKRGPRARGDKGVPNRSRAAAAASRPAGQAQGAGRSPRTEPPYYESRATTDDDPANFDTRLAAEVCRLLEERPGRPFLIVAGFHKPHVPHVAPKRFFDLYPPHKIQPIAVPAGDENDIPPAALASELNYQPLMPDQKKREIIAAYYACTTYLDAQVGEVMKTMDRLTLWDNTIVILLGDHGWNFGEHHWWAKASLFEESCHAALIIAGPGVKASGVCERVVEFVDLVPTLNEMCGVPAMNQAEGKSLVPLLTDPSAAWEKPAYTILGRNGRSIRTARYRYTEWDGGKAGAELYDHDTDPNELTNLANDPRHSEAFRQMKQLMAQAG